MGQRLKISPLVVFVGLFVWGFLLGGIGAILVTPMTLLVLLAMENFEGTRTVAVLMRYTGEAKKEERQEALTHAKGQWRKRQAAPGRVVSRRTQAVSRRIMLSEPFGLPLFGCVCFVRRPAG
jgi:hypothetical protein